ncbi:hypothetical protein ACTWKD_04050 [Halanaerobium saccharolyticum]|uniref:Uncharacterized protein n=1 Tax=Halanaerobium saccharolyticum TaxID=43595 RepID=A0A2T5RLJ7_9FIRM|nr:hypothetical protein [Halanaerobium saccharolyticum]PTW00126.1 hypothetical protein C8C76_10818 [Halanaerobium saccharolyticum]
MNNEITVKSYLFSFLIFFLMAILSLINFMVSNTLLFSLFIITTVIFGVLLIIFKPEKKIKIKYGDNTLINIG